MPLGAMAGGLLAGQLGLRATVAFCAPAAPACALPVLFSPVRKVRSRTRTRSRSRSRRRPCPCRCRCGPRGGFRGTPAPPAGTERRELKH